MNDFNDDSKFSFGKVELGVVPSVKVSSANHVSYYHKNSAKYKIYSALAKKRQASELLDGIRVGRLSYNEYCTIRDALEEMACVLEIYDDCTDGYEKGEGKIKNPITRHSATTHKNMRKRR